MEIYLIRHTRTVEESSRCFGHTDVALAGDFEAELQKLKEKIKDIDRATVFSSPLQRCRKMAEKISDEAPLMDDRLKELNFGDWEMKRWHEIDQPALQLWMKDYVNVACPNGESYLELYQRVSAFWQDLSTSPVEKAIIITHGGVIRAWLALILELPLEKSFTFDVPHGGISRIDWQNGRFQIKSVNS
jgi:alpha-ribazole phosphatase